MRILMVTSEWPTLEHPEWVPFLVQRLESLRQKGIDVTLFTFRGKQNPFNYLSAWSNLRRKYNLQHQFDLVDAQFGQSGLVALPCTLPLVVTYHGSDLQGFVGQNGQPMLKGRLLRQLSRFVARFASQNIVVSEHLGRHLPSSTTFTVIPCGIDLDLFRPIPRDEARRQLDLPTDRKLVLFPANPRNPIKRYQLATTVVRLARQNLDVDLLAVSNVPYEKMPLYMNACDALLITSQHEGSPTVVKEALACNLPIVTTDVGDVRRRLKGVSGCCVSSSDEPHVIADALSAVLYSPHRAAGRQAVSELDLRKIADRILNVYTRALSTAS